MADMGSDFLAQYQSYNPNFSAQSSAMPSASGGLGALPIVGAVMQGVGLLSGLYGSYKANQQADRDYKLRKQEFERQKRLEAEDRAIRDQEAMRSRVYDSAAYAAGDEGNRLARYANYFRGINL